MKIQGKASSIKTLMLTKENTIKLMWATLNSNPYKFPTHTNQTKQCSYLQSILVLCKTPLVEVATRLVSISNLL